MHLGPVFCTLLPILGSILGALGPPKAIKNY
jgi:hypothetical protein